MSEREPAAVVAAFLATQATELLAHFPDRERLERSLRTIARAVTCFGDMLPRGLSTLLHACSQTPDPFATLTNFERLFENAENPLLLLKLFCRTDHALRTVNVLFGYSQFLSDVLIRYPEFVPWLTEAPCVKQPKSVGNYRDEALALVQGADPWPVARDTLARWRRRELLRIGARDLLRLATIEEITREISDLAQACIAAATEVAWRQTVARYGEPQAESELQPRHTAGMCVIGMGKLGGRELNFSSDIDLIFIYEAEGETTGQLPDDRKVPPTTNHVFFNKMGENIVRFLSEPGEHGNLFRVDMRLRPEGKAGPLARSLESFANYLEQQARDWEKLAYLKARVMCGPAHLAERIYRFTQEFVFDVTEPEKIIREIEKLKLMIDREVHLSDVYHREVKRGYGGIREIEFVIAAMQILYGRMHRALRVRNIFLAIERLREVNLLTAEEADFYFEAYSFLRLVEHRLQMATEHQTHLLPNDPKALALLASRCHFSSFEEFEEKRRAVTDRVHQRFVRFFQQDVSEASRELSSMLVILDRDADEASALEALNRYGLGNKDILRLIHDLCYGTSEIFISAEGQRYFEQMLPSLLRLTARAPCPRAVITNFHSFVLSIKGITYYYELISQHPDILKLLVLLFGTSNWFSEQLISHPEYFDALITSRLLYDPVTKEAVAQRLTQSLQASRRLDRQLILLRRSVKFELLLVVLRRIVNLCALSATLNELSEVADACLEIGFKLAARRMLARLTGCEPHEVPMEEISAFGEEIHAAFSVLALGKYGGHEINFFSDLDVVYVFDDGPSMSSRRYLNTPARAINLADNLAYVFMEPLPEGKMFALDARLRPHGKNSPLVTPLSHYLAYLSGDAQVWEFLAITRARHVAGCAELSERVLEAARAAAARCPSGKELRNAVWEMRRKLEQSVSADDARSIEFKRSAGGLMDVEFLIQYLVLAGKVPWSVALGSSYFEILETLVSEPPIAREDWNAVRALYAYLRHVETAVRLTCAERGTSLPKNLTDLHNIAIQCGTANTEELKRELKDRMQQMRVIFARYIP